jgi:hypothetical protein
MEDPDAFWLKIVLKRHHWNRDFHVANGMAQRLNWSLRRLVQARGELIKRGEIVEIRAATQRKPALYRWPKSAHRE